MRLVLLYIFAFCASAICCWSLSTQATIESFSRWTELARWSHKRDGMSGWYQLQLIGLPNRWKTHNSQAANWNERERGEREREIEKVGLIELNVVRERWISRARRSMTAINAIMCINCNHEQKAQTKPTVRRFARIKLWYIRVYMYLPLLDRDGYDTLHHCAEETASHAYNRYQTLQLHSFVVFLCRFARFFSCLFSELQFSAE